MQDGMVWPLSLDKRASFGISTIKQMLIKAKVRIVGCDWCFHEKAGSSSLDLNLSPSVDLFNLSELLPEVNITHD